MSNVIILCNESGLIEGKAPLGQHSTLAYICAAILQKHSVFVIDHSRVSLQSCLESQSFPASLFDQSNFGKFINLYQQRNEILADLTKNAGAELLTSDSDEKWNEVAEREIVRVGSVIGRQVNLTMADLQNSYVLNRLDPMLASFTQADREAANGNVYQYFLAQYKKLVPKIEFSDPSGKGDKIAPQEVDEARAKSGMAAIYTPTWKVTIDNFDDKFCENFTAAVQAEQKLFLRTKAEFADLPTRIIFKPIDSAQSSGVCGIEFRENGLTLERLRSMSIRQLISEDVQLLYVQKNVVVQEIKEMAKVLLYAQVLKEEKTAHPKELTQISSAEMAKVIKRLYETEILIQPFLIGVAKMGDVRVNFVADAQGNWSCVGHTFRAQIIKEGSTAIDDREAIGSSFTTCFSAGKAAPTRVEYMLSSEEIQSFNQCVSGLLAVLNGVLKQSYAKCHELGVDFVLVGDGKNFMLGEINHTDPALAPVSLALRKGAYDLAVEIQKKPTDQLSEKEQKFLQNYHPIMAQEVNFVAHDYQGGLGAMITSLQNAIKRQDYANSTGNKQNSDL